MAGRITGPRLLEWSESGYATAPDGTEYMLQSSWPFGVPPRFYEFEIRRPGEGWTGVEHFRQKYQIEGGNRADFDGSTDKRTVMNRAERHAREFHAGKPKEN